MYVAHICTLLTAYYVLLMVSMHLSQLALVCKVWCSLLIMCWSSLYAAHPSLCDAHVYYLLAHVCMLLT